MIFKSRFLLIVLVLLTASVLMGHGGCRRYANDTAQTKLPANVMAASEITFRADKLENGRQGWVDPSEVVVLPDRSCGVLSYAAVVPQRDEHHLVLLIKDDQGQLAIQIPPDVKNVNWKELDEMPTFRSSANFLQPIVKVERQPKK